MNLSAVLKSVVKHNDLSVGSVNLSAVLKSVVKHNEDSTMIFGRNLGLESASFL